MDTKICSKCKTEKNVTDFNKKSNGKLRSDCKSCQSETFKKWRSENQAAAKLNSLSWYYKNKEKVLSGRKEARLTDPSVREKEHAYYEANKGRFKENLARRYRENPEKFSEYRQKRRARLKNANGSFTSDQIVELRSKQRARCACCGIRLSETGEHVDHIIPLALGGTNDISNIQLLCPTCNLQKNAKHPVDFMQQRGFLL